ncbi:uroporphyrinogen decarboxylase [Spirochaetia bacterium]|nr:uroporphyrinogen decarboxylase [Spirochaetia bacterium]
MTKVYSRRERVAEALNHREPDRVPCDLTISPPAYGVLCEHLGIKYEPYWWDDCNHAFPSVECLEKLDVDVMHIPAYAFVPKGFSMELPEFRDQWGVLRKKVEDTPGSFMYINADVPLKDAETVEDVLNYAWPTVDDLFDPSKIEELAKQLYKDTDFALTLVTAGHVFEMPHFLMGFERYLIDLYENEEIACAAMDKMVEINKKLFTAVMKACGKYLTYVRTNGEDIGTQNGPLLAPDKYRELVKPRHAEEWANMKNEFHKYNSDGKIAMHTCGSIKAFLPDIIDAGADIINPIQPNARDMDTGELKRLFGAKVCFHGGIDSQGALVSGSVDDVRAEVKRRINDLAPGGGYIATPSHNIQFGVPPENIIAMYDAIHEFGVYKK